MHYRTFLLITSLLIITRDSKAQFNISAEGGIGFSKLSSSYLNITDGNNIQAANRLLFSYGNKLRVMAGASFEKRYAHTKYRPVEGTFTGTHQINLVHLPFLLGYAFGNDYQIIPAIGIYNGIVTGGKVTGLEVVGTVRNEFEREIKPGSMRDFGVAGRIAFLKTIGKLSIGTSHQLERSLRLRKMFGFGGKRSFAHSHCISISYRFGKAPATAQ